MGSDFEINFDCLPIAHCSHFLSTRPFTGSRSFGIDSSCRRISIDGRTGWIECRIGETTKTNGFANTFVRYRPYISVMEWYATKYVGRYFNHRETGTIMCNNWTSWFRKGFEFPSFLMQNENIFPFAELVAAFTFGRTSSEGRHCQSKWHRFVRIPRIVALHWYR